MCLQSLGLWCREGSDVIHSSKAKDDVILPEGSWIIDPNPDLPTKRSKDPSQPHLCFCLHARVWLLHFIQSVFIFGAIAEYPVHFERHKILALAVPQ